MIPRWSMIPQSSKVLEIMCAHVLWVVFLAQCKVLASAGPNCQVSACQTLDLFAGKLTPKRGAALAPRQARPQQRWQQQPQLPPRSLTARPKNSQKVGMCTWKTPVPQPTRRNFRIEKLYDSYIRYEMLDQGFFSLVARPRGLSISISKLAQQHPLLYVFGGRWPANESWPTSRCTDICCTMLKHIACNFTPLSSSKQSKSWCHWSSCFRGWRAQSRAPESTQIGMKAYWTAIFVAFVLKRIFCRHFDGIAFMWKDSMHSSTNITPDPSFKNLYHLKFDYVGTEVFIIARGALRAYSTLAIPCDAPVILACLERTYTSGNVPK